MLPGCFGPKKARSTHAQELIDAALEGLKPGPILDAHLHIVGLGAAESGCWVHPRMTDVLGHPKDWAKFQIYQSAAGVEDLRNADSEYVRVLQQRLDSMPVPVHALVFAFDQVHDQDGTPQPALSEFFTPNAHVLEVASEQPMMHAVASVHPYRKDAVQALHAAAQAGAVAVKWLPNAQRIDPASALCDPAYKALKELGLPLITHAGHEKAVEAEEAQELGNPLRLRRPLEQGVRVIVAHCASLGEYSDSEDPLGTKRTSLELFLRLMDSPQYEGLLWGEISALTLLTRVEDALPRMLRRTDLHHRLVNGSDYPIPAIDPLINTWQLQAAGLIAPGDRAALSELWSENPLLFDFVLKRHLRTEDAPHARFAASIFQPPESLFSRIPY